MRKIISSTFVSLDGVMQAPGGKTEDPTGGFRFGGWLPPHFDDTVGKAMGEVFSTPFDLLFGRKTYEIFAAHWPYVEGEDKMMGEMLTAATKYVLTRGGTELAWDNSVALADIDAVRALKAEAGNDILIQGSSTLFPQLLDAGLIDEMTLLIFPVILGHGKRLFGDGTPSRSMKLVEQKRSDSGVIIARYQPGGELETGGLELEKPSEREVARQERMKREG